MRRRPVYRWCSFWLGLFVLVFFAWAWRWSMANGKSFWVDVAGGYFDIGIDAGAFSVLKGKAWVAGVDGMGPTTDDVIWRPDWALLKKEEAAGAVWWIVFPMWVPLEGWLAVWGGWMVWRWRRMRVELAGQKEAGG